LSHTFTGVEDLMLNKDSIQVCIIFILHINFELNLKLTIKNILSNYLQVYYKQYLLNIWYRLLLSNYLIFINI